jgi:urease accessory protein UreE
MIQVFRSLPVIRSVNRAESLPLHAARYRFDTVTLGWEDRLKVRARRISDQGFEFATVLDRGHVLRDGDCFVFDAPGLVIRVVEQAEPVVVIQPRTQREAALFSYHIGNSHQPLMLTDAGAIVCPDGPGMEQILSYHAIPFARDRRPFTPIDQLTDHRHQIEP